jgi:mannose-6-phosphate isomerase-like protein (cupin superfamily)
MLESFRNQEFFALASKKVWTRIADEAQAMDEARMALATKVLAGDYDVLAPDKSEVRLLTAIGRGSMAHFRLGPGLVSHAVRHRTVEELWFFTAGKGRMWRKLGAEEAVVEVGPGVSIAIPTGAAFQFRCDGDEPLEFVGVTMPPWPGADEAVFTVGAWEPTA